MIAATAEAKAWPRRHWWLLLALIFTGQLGFIFALSDRAPLKVRPPARAPVLRLAGSDSAEWLTLLDPTLFALPHRQGFSAAARQVRPPQEIRTSPPPEPMDYLPLPLHQLGAAYHQPTDVNRFDATPVWPEPAPNLGLPTLFSPAVQPAPSLVRVQGELGNRRLIRPIAVPSWPHSEILSNSVVQIVVDADGRTASPGALLSSSGSKDADLRAVDLARQARFDSVSGSSSVQGANPAGRLTWVRLIFEWQTVPLPLSNAPPATLQP